MLWPLTESPASNRGSVLLLAGTFSVDVSGPTPTFVESLVTGGEFLTRSAQLLTTGCLCYAKPVVFCCCSQDTLTCKLQQVSTTNTETTTQFVDELVVLKCWDTYSGRFAGVVKVKFLDTVCVGAKYSLFWLLDNDFPGDVFLTSQANDVGLNSYVHGCNTSHFYRPQYIWVLRYWSIVIFETTNSSFKITPMVTRYRYKYMTKYSRNANKNSTYLEPFDRPHIFYIICDILRIL